ncbi:MAG: hypothetical protein JWP88_147, partial [Flaviaesturariibacter sp.]|nr:hypothetical protein [Flaviaesturariibacter sp.]
MLCAVTSNAQEKGIKPRKIDSTLTVKPAAIPSNAAQRDSVRLQRRTQTAKVGSDSAASIGGNQLGKDSLRTITDTFSLRLSKDTLDAPISYEAEDSAVIFVPEKKVILYGKTKTTHKDAVLTAPQVELDQQTSIITAISDRDSLGEILTRARMEQAENKFESDTIRFNLKTQRGLTKNTFTQQNEMFIQGEVIKKVDANTVNISRGRFTTCDLDDPHFAFRANKLKVINNKVAISGPMHPEFEGVPVPIYLPFGYYPLSKGRHSGLLPPQFTATENYGLGLEGLGYYKVLNDNFDITARANIYSYGGWRGDLSSSYRVRYRYAGAVNLSYQNTKINFKGDPDYNKTKTFLISWNHSVDPRARPGVSFSANVNAGSTRFNRYVTNNVIQPFQNQLTSSISYQKTWKDKPFNLSLSANHSQNSVSRLIDLTIPDGSFSVNTLYPFERGEDAIGAAKWYEKLGIGYNGVFRNKVSFYDSAFSFAKLLDTLQWGASHSIPLVVALPSLGPLLVSPSVSFQQQWINRRLTRSWNSAAKKVDTTYERGFYTASSLTFGLGFSTSFFGTYQFRHSRIMAIRHSVRPQFSFNYSPNLAKNYYRTVQADTTGNTFLSYSLYEGNLYTGYSNNEFGGIGFGLDNSLEMKVKGRKDTIERKV